MTISIQPKFRRGLPQLEGGLFLSDGGLETTLIFHEGWDIPNMAAFVLLESERGRETLRQYFDRYIPMALGRGAGFILETPTWRANPDWGARLGYDLARLADVNRSAVAFTDEIRRLYEESQSSPMILSGCLGPRGDGYDPGSLMTADEAESYHAWQIAILRDAGADLVTSFTMTNSNEALGIARAAKKAGIPSVISFTLETDGRLPTGESLSDVIVAIDEATATAPAYYMINCAHPTHFSHILEEPAPWAKRVRGLRANSSQLSHAELDNAAELDVGNPEELGQQYGELLHRHPHINVLGGCCGTDHRHIRCISDACRTAA
jgi:S-methylmethionine-dependent homocysteine/selenocysteine methylase